jgi:hypothetical protein
MPALRTIVAAIVVVGVGVLAAGALAAPSADPQPTPPPGSGGGGGSSGGGGGGGGTSRPAIRRPVGPVAVANGRAGAVLLEATGERTKEPTAAGTVTPPVTTTPPPTTTAETPATTAEAPATTASAPATTAQAPVTTAEVAPPAATTPQPTAAGSSGGRDSGTPSLPRDGIVVLIGVLLLGVGVALRAIRSRERRIGLALLGFCVVYLLALAGFVTGVAGAATANPVGFGATAVNSYPKPASLTAPKRLENTIGWRFTVK